MTLTKICGKCDRELPSSEFSRFARASDGLQRWCKTCASEHKKACYRADPERFRRRSREYYRAVPLAERPAFNRRNNLKKYGLSPEAFDALLERQAGRCAVCRTDDPGGRHDQWHVDHDHSCCPGPRTCGTCTRAILCEGCNIGLGHFEDDALRLMAAADYLLKWANR